MPGAGPHLCPPATKKTGGCRIASAYLWSLNDAGKVIGHATIYKILAFQVVLAESGGTPNQVTALASNPLTPGDWSDKAAEKFDLPLDWLEQPEYSITAASDRFCEVHKIYNALFLPKEIGRLSDSVFSEYGLGREDVIPEAIREQAFGELFDRAARHMVGIPYEMSVTEDQLRKALETKSEDQNR